MNMQSNAIENQFPVFFREKEAFPITPEENAFFKIIFLEQGNGIFSLNGKKIIASAPSVFCLNEKEAFSLIEGKDIASSSFYFSPDVINSRLTLENIRENKESLTLTEKQDLYYLELFFIHDSRFSGRLSITQPVLKRLRFLFDSLKKELVEHLGGDCWTCVCRSFLIEILFLLDRVKNSECNSDITIPDGMDEIILYLYNNYTRKITLNELAKVFRTNRTTLADQFRKAAGLPVITYLIKLRVEIASLMLRNTVLNISEIAERTGFSGLTHFGRFFKKFAGFSPSEYRQQFKWIADD